MSEVSVPGEQDRLNLALSAAHMGTWDWDVPSGVIWWDERMHALFGLAPGAFTGRYEAFLDLLHEEDRKRIGREIAVAMEGCAEFDEEFRAVWPSDGSIHILRMRSKVCCDDDAKVTRITGVAWDITERRHTELALARERSLLSTLMKHLPDHIYFKDRDSRFVAVNRAMARWAGRENPADLIGKTDQDLFTGEHAEAALEDERRIIRTGRPIIGHEERETWADREDTWVSTTKMPLVDTEGRIVGTFGLSRDVTERKRADEKLVRLTEELRAKNEALQEDLEMARELQNALLPQRFPRFPHGVAEKESAVHFYHFFQPSMIVSGDFFDVLDISDDKAGLFICDVMGHGVRAALVAATVRSLIGELRPVWTEPGAFLFQLNRALIEAFKNSNITLFASAFYVVADLSCGELRYANAGHPRPLRVAHGGKEARARSAPLNGGGHGPALGLIRGADYHTCHCALSPRDVLLLFTDGLFEVEGLGGHFYDYRQLTRAVGDRARLPTQELCHSLIDEVQRFSANRQFSDDVCLVAMDIERVAEGRRNR